MANAIEDRLTEDLHASVAGIQLPAGLLVAARRRNDRRRLTVRVAAGTTAVAAVTGVVATTMSGGSPAAPHQQAIAPRPTAASTIGSPKFTTVAYVLRRIAQAPDPAHEVIRTTARDDGQVNDNWADQDTGYLTAYTHEHGRLVAAIRYPITKRGRALSIDYEARTWFAVPQGPNPTNRVVTGKVGEPLIDTVAGIKAAVQRADVTIVGRGTVAGRPATRLRFVYRETAGNSVDTIRGEAWFDSQTYAPLRATTTYESSAPSAALPAANGRPLVTGSTSITIETSFLPRTAGNLARTRLTVPNGFRQVSPPGK